jgi:hypothetical protein
MAIFGDAPASRRCFAGVRMKMFFISYGLASYKTTRFELKLAATFVEFTLSPIIFASHSGECFRGVVWLAEGIAQSYRRKVGFQIETLVDACSL